LERPVGAIAAMGRSYVFCDQFSLI